MGNKAAYIHLRGSDLRPQFHQFTAVVSLPPSLGQSGEPFWGRERGQCGLVSASGAPRTPLLPQPHCWPVSVSDPVPLVLQPHPDVKPMAYASTLLQLGMM